MKFLVDAQLPRRLAWWLRNQGHEAVHTLDLPKKNKTGDDEINQISMTEKLVLISKDIDFYDRYFENLEPYKLLFLTVGNIKNDDLIVIFEKNISRLIEELEKGNVIELSQKTLTIIA